MHLEHAHLLNLSCPPALRVPGNPVGRIPTPSRKAFLFQTPAELLFRRRHQHPRPSQPSNTTLQRFALRAPEARPRTGRKSSPEAAGRNRQRICCPSYIPEYSMHGLSTFPAAAFQAVFRTVGSHSVHSCRIRQRQPTTAINTSACSFLAPG